jgi:O-antigen/teichoic acid export membrane protein
LIRRLFRRKFIRDTIALQIGKIGTTGMSVLSSLLVVRLMDVETYGVWSLAQSFFTIWQTLNLTGISISTSTRLAMAVGAKDEPEILNLSALYIQVSLAWASALTILMILTGPLLAGLAYNGDTRIGVLAVWLSLTTLPDALYNLIIIALQSQRSMQTLAVLTNLNQLVFLISTAGALLISPTPESLVVGRLIYSTSTMLIAFWFYGHERLRYAVPYPTLRAIFSHIHRVSPRRYWRFGFLNAIDKNIANLYTEIPLQMVGIFAGRAAAGYLEVGFKALTISATFTSAVSDNLQAVIPQAVGRRDFVNLRHNLTRVVVTMGLAAIGFYTVFVLAVPLIVLLFGHSWIPASPVIALLAIYGGVSMLGGIFGPLYRALNLLTPAIIAKVVTLIVILLPGWLWMQRMAAITGVWTVTGLPILWSSTLWQTGAVGGAWIVNGLFIVSILLTVAVTIPPLNTAAKQRALSGV